MSVLKFAWFLFRKDRALQSKSVWILALSLSLGIAAIVALDLFSRRIESTLQRDSKGLLAADFQVQAWRPFDEKVWQAVAPYKALNHVVEQSDFLSAMRVKDTQTLTVSVRTLQGNGYPFYGEWITTPQLTIHDLEAEPSIVLDQSFKAKGVVLGEFVKLGTEKLKVIAFLIQEPQTVAGAFAMGPRVVVHRKWGLQTGLMGKGARVFNQLLIKSPKTSEEFKKSFRDVAADPHWRLITPEHANRQIDKVIARLRGFLSFVALTGLFLGSVGLFMVFRSQFLAKLPEFLTLRCLGAKARSLLYFSLLQSLFIAFVGSAAGVALGVAIESFIRAFAASQLNMVLADVSHSRSLALGVLVTLVGVITAVLVPMSEVLQIPLQHAIRMEESSQQVISKREVSYIAVAVIFLVALVARDVKLGLSFLGIFAGTIATLYLFARLLSVLLKVKKFSLVFEQAKLLYLRKPSRSLLIVISIGLSLFFLQNVLMIGFSLRSQLDVVNREGIPNIFLIGLSDATLPAVQKTLPALEAVPMAQARITELKGVAITESEEPDESSERFYQTREYFVTKRNALASGERLSNSAALFGPPKAGIVRLSLEQKFAENMKLKLGDQVKIELAGVVLAAEVQSFRKVDWFNFRPNFFMVLNADDIEGAPMDYVGFARVAAKDLGAIQNALAQAVPQVTVLDGESLALRLKKILGQLSFSVYSVSLFSVGSCFFVFLGMMLARRQEMIKEMALLKCLGLRSTRIMGIYVWESTITLGVGIVVSFATSLLSASLVCKYFLDIGFEWPPALWPVGMALVILGIGNLLVVLFIGQFRNTRYRDLLDAVEN